MSIPGNQLPEYKQALQLQEQGQFDEAEASFRQVCPPCRVQPDLGLGLGSPGCMSSWRRQSGALQVCLARVWAVVINLEPRFIAELRGVLGHIYAAARLQLGTQFFVQYMPSSTRAIIG